MRLPVIEVRYEQLVHDPAAQLRRVADFVGLPVSNANLKSACMGIIAGREGVGRGALSPAELDILDAEVGALLAELGYDPPRSPHTADYRPEDLNGR